MLALKHKYILCEYSYYQRALKFGHTIKIY